MVQPKDLFEMIKAAPFSGRRRLVALVGPPASGKSTLAQALAKIDQHTQVVPMDGFHLDNSVLSDRGVLHRKGAPETFDVAGFLHLVERLRTEDDVIFPVFDRSRDLSIAGVGVILHSTETVIVEGNYLMLDRPHWRDLARLWDFSVRIDVPFQVLRQRLLQRWLDHDYSQAQATEKARSNDLPNAELVQETSLQCDVVIAGDQITIASSPAPATANNRE